MKPLPGSPNICLWVREYSSTVVADQRCGWKTMVRLLQLLTMTKCGSSNSEKRCFRAPA